MTKEVEWRPVVGWEGYYSVSSDGRVRSEDRTIDCGLGRMVEYKSREKKTHIDNNGYPSVALCKNRISYASRVHTLVANAFIGKRPEGNQVDHIDGNKTNNNVSNLRYVSPRDNVIFGCQKRETTSKYTGVTRDRGKWKASIKHKGKNIFLGRFEKEESAAEAYNKKRQEIENGI